MCVDREFPRSCFRTFWRNVHPFPIRIPNPGDEQSRYRIRPKRDDSAAVDHLSIFLEGDGPIRRGDYRDYNGECRTLDFPNERHLSFGFQCERHVCWRIQHHRKPGLSTSDYSGGDKPLPSWTN